MNASVGASYSIAGASLSAHYGSKETGGDDDTTIIGAKVGYSIAGISLGITYHVQDTGEVSDNKLRFDAGYGLGGGMKASFRFNTSDGDSNSRMQENPDGTITEEELDAQTDWRIMLSKSF